MAEKFRYIGSTGRAAAVEPEQFVLRCPTLLLHNSDLRFLGENKAGINAHDSDPTTIHGMHQRRVTHSTV